MILSGSVFHEWEYGSECPLECDDDSLDDIA